jgi:hypothetical protein
MARWRHDLFPQPLSALVGGVALLNGTVVADNVGRLNT